VTAVKLGSALSWFICIADYQGQSWEHCCYLSFY